MRLAALRCLTQLSKQPDLAAAILASESIGKLVLRATSEEAERRRLGGGSRQAELLPAEPSGAVTGVTPALDVTALAGADVGAAAAEVGPEMAGAIASLLQLLLPLIIDGGAAARRVTDASPIDASSSPVASTEIGDCDAPDAAAAEDSTAQPLALPAAIPAFSRQDAVVCLKALAAITRGSPGAEVARSSVVRAMLVLTEAEFAAPARPPLPSPPGTPPPLPLATSQFVWDALGRPSMTDGAGVKLAHL